MLQCKHSDINPCTSSDMHFKFNVLSCVSTSLQKGLCIICISAYAYSPPSLSNIYPTLVGFNTKSLMYESTLILRSQLTFIEDKNQHTSNSFNPPSSHALQTMFFLNRTVSRFCKKYIGGSGRFVNKWITLDTASVLIIVIFPSGDRCL